MVVSIGPELEVALKAAARRQGMAPEQLVEDALRKQFLAGAALQPRDEWERRLLGGARDWGVSLPDSAVSSDGLND